MGTIYRMICRLEAATVKIRIAFYARHRGDLNFVNFVDTWEEWLELRGIIPRPGQDSQLDGHSRDGLSADILLTPWL